MKAFYKVFLSVAVIIIAQHNAMAQLEGTMPFMKSLPQVTYYNPAFKPAYNFSIGIPGSSIFAGVSNNGFTYNDFISKENNEFVANLDNLSGVLRKKNYINTNLQVDLFRVSVKANARLYLTFNATAKVYSRMMLPKDIISLFVDGTERYVNRTANISPEVEALSYAEFGFGGGYTVNDKLTVGAKLKLLKGIVNATSEKASFNVSVADDYSITVVGDADIKTSGIHRLEDDDNYEIENNWKDFTKNNGFAIDLGATYELNDKITLGASLIDLGSINWKNDTYGYKLDPSKANYTFKGIDMAALLNGEGDYSESLSDSLEENFDFTEGKIGKYKTPLPGKMYLTGVYKIRKMLSVGGLIGFEKYRGRFMPAFTASLNKDFGRRVGTSLSYTITNNSFNNIGAGLSLNFSPVQFYLVGDNLLRAPLTLLTKDNLNPYINNLQYFNIRLGLNFVFGRDKVQEKQTHSKSK